MIRKYLRHRRAVFLFFAVFCLFFTLLLYLYGGGLDGASYFLLIAAFLLALWTAVDGRAFARRMRALDDILHNISAVRHDFPLPDGPLEETYQDIAVELCRLLNRKTGALEAAHADQLFYYTRWLHQIKTPIAAMGLLLQGDETDRGRELRSELFRVEQYVTLALSYLRLVAETTDYVIRKQDLDPILRQAARKYAALFIRGRVALALRPTGLRVLTDEKWLQLVVEQVLSNAVKYAPGGHVTVYARDSRLIIEDDGVGIAREDLPRIFERGFTGCNGRLDKRATGIGLYLCREICRRLGHTITVDAEPGRGTRVIIGLERPFLEVE